MDNSLKQLLADLEQQGLEHDRQTENHSEKMLNITADTGELLVMLVCLTRARNILEVGTSNGYSTLWLASAASELNSLVTTIEQDASKIELAGENFARAGLSQHIRQYQGDAGLYLTTEDTQNYEMIFLDSARDNYVQWWPELRRLLKPGGVLVVDNAISHQAELAPFMELVGADNAFVTQLLPVGKGEFLAVKQSF
ncbi:O-methyltransferase [Marinobacterium jannaschii]|uniref:O-methyltransferase n=1 Tax=Marinobacterium jannaschii TaxID=64970 RepID=UPI000485EEE9|nr:O-methyltransferase [Marinobacterium jannaschii]